MTSLCMVIATSGVSGFTNPELADTLTVSVIWPTSSVASSRALWPVVLFTIGYGDNPIASESLHTTAAVVLAKPLGSDEVLALRRLLDNR